MSNQNNNRIAKNTLMLYLRMSLTMFVSLFTSRVILNVLGVEDYGIYNVVAGVVTMFSFLNSAMALGTQRFLAFEMGKNNPSGMNNVFKTSINIHVGIAILIVLLSETIGVWFLNTQLTIPADRMIAANWVFQLSMLNFALVVITVPYNAAIIANERMSFYAYVSILETVLKLIAVIALVNLPFDHLKTYAFLILIVSFLVFVAYRYYSIKKFAECNYSWYWNPSLFKEMMGYTGWNLFGNVAYVSYNQGINIILNVFFGPAINAARGIAYQVNGAISGFAGNFQLAMNPQITKSYSSNELDYMHQLIYSGSKFSFFLLYCITLPILIETDKILYWWLKIVPDHAILFCRLVLIQALIDSISLSLKAGVQASGKIKWFQIIIGSMLFLILPISYLFLYLGYSPVTPFIISIVIAIIALSGRLYMVGNIINLSISKFVKKVIFKIVLVVVFSPVVPLLWKYWTNSTTINSLISIFISGLSGIVVIYFLGLASNEKRIILKKIQSIIKRFGATKVIKGE